MSTREKVMTWWWAGVLLAVAALGTVSVFASGLDKQPERGRAAGGTGDAVAVGTRLVNYSGRDTTRTSNINARLVGYSTNDTYRAAVAGGTAAARFYCNTSYIPMVNLWRALRWKYTDYNDGGYTLSNLSAIVVPTAGKYIITASGQWDALPSTETKMMRITVNGTIHGSANALSGAGAYFISNRVSEIVNLSANSRVRVECKSTGTNSVLNAPAVAISAVNSSAIQIRNYTGIAAFAATVMGSSAGAVDDKSATFKNDSGFLMVNNHGVRFRVFLSASTIMATPR